MRENGGKFARFKPFDPDPETAFVLAPDHPAVVEGRTLFPTRVTAGGDRYLISGHNNAKIGREVRKGPWAGMPIFTLTLEERATCPRSCAQWANCYGSGMPYPKRWDHRDPLFIDTLRAEIITVARSHPKGLVVRLHVLGDFYSLPYTRMWIAMVGRFPQLHIYGYTARREDLDSTQSRLIATLIREANDAWPDRFSIRFSRTERGRMHTIVVDSDPQLDDVIVCPAQVKATETCGSCGLCWAPAAADKTIAFLRHGMRKGGRPALPAKGREDRFSASRARQAQERKKPRAEERPKRRGNPNWNAGVGPAGRPIMGAAFDGETADQRKLRIIEYVRAHPDLDESAVALTLGITMGVLLKATNDMRAIERQTKSKLGVFMPRQIFTPSAIKSTPEERIASLPDDVKAQIAARYGAVIKPKSA